MTEPTEPNKTIEITRLLKKAVDALPDAERQAVYEYFLERAVMGQHSPVFGALARHGARRKGAPGGGLLPDPPLPGLPYFATQKPGPQQVMIPVRMSEDLHARLKAWSTEHGFPMSVVVRGLVDRFLDSWEERAA